jgi:hypothetical protein
MVAFLLQTTSSEDLCCGDSSWSIGQQDLHTFQQFLKNKGRSPVCSVLWGLEADLQRLVQLNSAWAQHAVLLVGSTSLGAAQEGLMSLYHQLLDLPKPSQDPIKPIRPYPGWSQGHYSLPWSLRSSPSSVAPVLVSLLKGSLKVAHCHFIMSSLIPTSI